MFLRQVHRRIVDNNGEDTARTKRLLSLFNCASDSDRNAANPIKLGKMFLSSLGIGPSVLSGGTEVSNARSSLEIMILVSFNDLRSFLSRFDILLSTRIFSFPTMNRRYIKLSLTRFIGKQSSVWLMAQTTLFPNGAHSYNGLRPFHGPSTESRRLFHVQSLM